MELLNQPSFDAYRSRPAIAAPGHPQETDEVLLLYPHNIVDPSLLSGFATITIAKVLFYY